MYPSSALLGQNKDKSIAALPVDDLIEKADGFAGVFPGTVFYLWSLIYFSRNCSGKTVTKPSPNSTAPNQLQVKVS